MKCRTIAPNGTKVRLLKSGKVVQPSVVRNHRLAVVGRGKASGHVISVDVSRKVRYRLAL